MLRRARVHGAPVLSIALTVLVVCTLVSALWGSLSLLQRQALRAALASAPGDATVVSARASYDAELAAARDDAVRAALAPVLEVSGGRLVGVLESGPHDRVDAPARTTGLTLAAVTGAGDTLGVTTGRWPQAVPGPRIEVAVPARDHERVGDRLVLRSRVDGHRVVARVVGAWQGSDEQHRTLGDLAPTTLLVATDEFPSVTGPGASATWRAVPDLDRLLPADLGRLAGAVDSATHAVEVAGEELPGTLTHDTGLVEVLDARAGDLTVLRGLLLGPVGLLGLVAVAGLALLAAGLAAVRGEETALWRSRGAGRWQMVAPTALEAVLVCGAAALLAPVLATALVRIGQERVPLDAETWLAAAVAAAVCAAALVLPAALAASTGDRGEQLGLERQRRRALTGLAALVLLAVALGLLGVLRLQGFGDTVAASSVGSTGVDALLVAAPALVLLALAVPACLLVVPPVLAGVARLFSGSGVPVVLGSRFAARAPGRSVPLALAVTLAAGTAGFALVERDSSGASRVARADHVAGADLRVTAPPSAVRAGPAEERRVLAGLPGVDAVQPVHRRGTFLGDLPAEVLVAPVSAATVPDLLGADTPRGAWEPLLETPTGGTPVPVALSADLASAAALTVGDTVSLAVLGETIDVKVVSTVPWVRTAPDTGGAVLIDAAALTAATGPLGAPQEWWVGADRPEQVAAALAEHPHVATSVLTRGSVLRTLAEDPATGGSALPRVLLLTTAGSLGVGALVLVSAVLLRRRERIARARMIGAAGGARRDLVGTLAWELGLTTGLGVAVGVPAGAVVAAVTLSSLALGPSGRPLVPAPEVVVPWVPVLLAPLVMVTVPLLLLVWLVRHDPALGGPALVADAVGSGP